MADPLAGARTRVVHARRHFELVQGEWDALPQEAKSITLRSEYKSSRNKIRVLIDSVPSLDQRWALELSESLFNLRAALDYVAWELAKWNLQSQGQTREPRRTTQFPIALTEKDFQDRWVVDIHPSHVAVLKWLQPYSPSHLAQYSNAILRGMDTKVGAIGHIANRLQELNNADKHRLLAVAALGSHITEIGAFAPHDCEVANPNFYIQAGTFEVGAKWAEFDVIGVSGPAPRVEVPVVMTTAIQINGVNVQSVERHPA